jgi:hypothetical protein
MKTMLNLSARFDRSVFSKEISLTQDFKTGYSEPDPVRLNAQMRVIAMLVALNLIRAGHNKIKRFIVQIISMHYGVMEAEFSWAELAGLYDSTLATLASLESATAALQPSPEVCDKCPAILVCPAVQRLVVRANPIDTTPAELARNLDKVAMIKEYCEQFEEFCKKGLLAEPPKFAIPGYEMAPGAETRKFTDIETAKSRMCELDPSVSDALNKLKTHTPPNYLKVYATFYNRDPKDCKEAFDKLMNGQIVTTQNKSSLKRVKNEIIDARAAFGGPEAKQLAL